MKEQVALITGAGGGIGHATAELFLEKGWKVAGIDKKQNMQLPHECLSIQADCSRPREISHAVQAVSETWGQVNVLVNNAGTLINRAAIDTSIEDWNYTLNVNLRATFLFAKECHEMLKQSFGRIVNIGSIHAVATSIDISAYAAAKGGIVSLTRALAIEWAKDNIRVNAVLPGAVDTPMLRKGLNREIGAGENPEKRMQDLAQKTVLGRVAQPSEIAHAVMFLADQHMSSFITGHTLVVDGGATIKLSTE